MDKFYNVYGVTLAVAQDCSIIEFATLRQAIDSSPICVLRAKLSFERMLIRGLKESWYQHTRYEIYSPNGSTVESLKIGNWLIQNFLLPRNADTLLCDFVDPIGKTLRQEFKGTQDYKALSQAFRKIRELNNYESALNYSLVLENQRLREELEKLRKGT